MDKKKGLLVDFETYKGDKDISAYERYIENKEIFDILKEREESNSNSESFSIADLEKINEELISNGK